MAANSTRAAAVRGWNSASIRSSVPPSTGTSVVPPSKARNGPLGKWRFTRYDSFSTHSNGSSSKAGTACPLLRQGIAGAAGGLIAFILLEPGSLARDTEQLHHVLGGAEILKDLREMGFFGAVIGACIAGALTLGDELGSGRAARIGGRAALALAVGAAIGGAAGLAAQVLFQSLLVGGVLPVARTLGWALLGAGMGVAAGAVTGA